MYFIPSAHGLHPRPPCIYSGRADNACTNLLGFFVRCVRTRGSMRLRGAVKPPTFALPFVAHTRHAWLARLTRARRGGSEGGRRESSLLTFAALLVTQKRDKRKTSLRFFAGEQCSPLLCEFKVQQTAKRKNQMLFSLFLLHIQAQKKKLSKRKRRKKISRSAERDKGSAPLNAPPFEKGGRKLLCGGRKL